MRYLSTGDLIAFGFRFNVCEVIAALGPGCFSIPRLVIAGKDEDLLHSLVSRLFRGLFPDLGKGHLKF